MYVSFHNFDLFTSDRYSCSLKYLRAWIICRLLLAYHGLSLISSQINIKLTRTNSPPLIKFDMILIQTIPT
jgi:hypothetical protein